MTVAPETVREASVTDVGATGGEPENNTPFKALRLYRGSEKFEILRLNTEKFLLTTGHSPHVFLFTYGNLAMRKARAMFATNFFGCTGFVIDDHTGFQTVDEGISEINKVNPDIVVICSSDEEYSEIVPLICKSLKASSKPPKIVLAGFPKDQIEYYRSEGVDEFIHIRSNVLEMLTKFQNLLGI